MELHGDIAGRYRDFAVYASGDSACFEEWSLGVAEDEAIHEWLAGLPEIKQQPNLVFAAARWHGVAAPAPYAELKRGLIEHETAIKRTILERSTQTNEVGRLATLVPALALLPGRLSLVEVGASAGLCLYPDRYSYTWSPLGALEGPEVVPGAVPGVVRRVVLSAQAEGPMPVPGAPVRVVQRIGLDLHPLDVYDPDAMAWLENLVWPEQDDRRERLRSAVELAREDPPDLRRGDLLEEVETLVEEAGRWATPVVFHSAVVAYLDRDARERFAATMRDLVGQGACHWISNEAPRVVPGIAVPEPVPEGRFLLALNGSPLAWTHGHGTSISWL